VFVSERSGKAQLRNRILGLGLNDCGFIKKKRAHIARVAIAGQENIEIVHNPKAIQIAATSEDKRRRAMEGNRNPQSTVHEGDCAVKVSMRSWIVRWLLMKAGDKAHGPARVTHLSSNRHFGIFWIFCLSVIRCRTFSQLERSALVLFGSGVIRKVAVSSNSQSLEAVFKTSSGVPLFHVFPLHCSKIVLQSLYIIKRTGAKPINQP
jgi:hypothetical protein